MYLHTYVPSEDSDQTAQMRSLIRIFTGRAFWIANDAMFLHAYNEDVVFIGAHGRKYVCWRCGSYNIQMIVRKKKTNKVKADQTLSSQQTTTFPAEFW